MTNIRELRASLSTEMQEADTRLSVGALGAIAEFSRDEPTTVVSDASRVEVATSRGGIRTDGLEKARPAAYETTKRETAPLSDLEFLLLPFKELRPSPHEAGDGASSNAAIPHLSVRPEDVLAFGEQAIGPPWHWIVALASALALHAAIVLLFALGSPQSVAPPAAIDATILSEADAAPDQPSDPAPSTDKAAPTDANPPAPDMPRTPVAAEPQPEPEPVEKQPDVDVPSPPASDPTPAAAEAEQTPAPAPQAVAADSRASPPPEAPPAPALTTGAELPPVEQEILNSPAKAEANPAPVAPEPPSPEPSPPSARPRPEKINNAAQTKPPRAIVDARPKPAEKPPKPAALEKKPSPAATAQAFDSGPVRQAAKVGGAQGNPGTSQMSRAGYGMLLLAEIARHKVYPEAARTAGATGSVGVTLTVGPLGRIVNHAITQSSGDAAIDNEVHAMMAAVQAPSPPGGRFQARVMIRFGLQ